MDLEYDQKFEEMKKYIPFLESMIKRLESTSSSSNPRQAQLDKIRSLRDLLMDKKKRMKMENLLKCEQVLVNLYEKVECNSSPGGKKSINSTQKSKPDLNTARNKLKSSVSKVHNESIETLPEIARASQIEEICVPGSKEPALFQRRPNKSPIRHPQNKSQEPSPQLLKRNYTRVLLSPDRSQTTWSTEENSDKPLFSRRSPKKSPRGRSPSHHKKERKKGSKNKSKQNLSQDLNITLNVPEESLNSLNTKDILSRIINCSDRDVDIDTLRELRSQILGELKETGTNEDISDLILKSYKKKTKTGSKPKEVEEGELSDSESEAIESIYGSLVIVDKEKVSTSVLNNETDDEQPRKIQICLVINSDKTKDTPIKEGKNRVVPIDVSDFESLINKENNTDTKVCTTETHEEKKLGLDQTTATDKQDQLEQKATSLVQFGDIEEVATKNLIETKVTEPILKDDENIVLQKQSESVEKKETNKFDSSTPVTDQDNNIDKHIADNKFQEMLKNSPNLESNINKAESTPIEESNIQIPLLEPTKDVSEIDILQALKKEILCETDNVLSADADTPLLHQPKITKVVNANEVGTKKRISIEKYKSKTNPCLITAFDSEISNNNMKDDSKKQSLKLTEKECERFNFPSKLTLDESSEEEDNKSNLSLDDIYGNLAPKSPDHEDFADTGIKPPVIIPSDPVQAQVVNSAADIDMRKILPNIQPKKEINNLSSSNTLPLDKVTKNNEKPLIPLHDPRMKRDMNITKSESPNPYLMNVDKLSRPPINYTPPIIVHNINSSLSLNRNAMLSPSLPTVLTPNINITSMPNLVSNMTPNRTPNMTPNAKYDMTPSRQSVETDDFGNRKHVYAPMFPADNRDHGEKLRDNQRQSWEHCDKNNMPFWGDVDHRDNDNRPPQFQNSLRGDRFNFDLDRRDCQSTPSHSFGRVDCPTTPIPSFGRMDAPMTPIHPFGRSDCPSTPIHHFGRSECPSTPSHPFGRSDCPSTPNHPFGRSDGLLPLPFARSDYSQPVQNQSIGKPQDPRLNRNSDYDNFRNRDDDRERTFYLDNKLNSYRSDRSKRNNNDYYGRYQREQSVGRHERDRNCENSKNYDNSGRIYRDSRRETSVGRYNRDYDNDRTYLRNHHNKNYDFRNQNESRNYDDRDRRYQRERSISQTSRLSPRDSSTSKTFSKENKLSVQRHTGHFFTIDTSINSSFQDIGDIKNTSFDARRQRAASVGRGLCRDSSPNRLNKETKHNSINFNEKNKKPEFRRACSVGRDIKESNLNFKDLKEDLKSFKLKGDSRWTKEINNKQNTSKTSRDEIKFDPRSRKDIYDSRAKSNSDKSKYSPKKNIRDPRMRRENINENKCNYRDNYRSKSKDSKNYGIVYSTDNITKGTILGPGYGVKNYKIPKLKRHNEENKEDTDRIENNEEVSVAENNYSDKKQTNKIDGNLAKTKDGDSNQSRKETKPDKTFVQKSKVTNKELDSVDNAKLKIENIKANISDDKKINDSNSDENTPSDKKQAEDTVANNSIDLTERRITRSTSRRISKDSSAESSPVKRQKRVRKPLVYESDSDDNDKILETTTTTELSVSKSKNKRKETLSKDSNETLRREISDVNKKDISKTQDSLSKTIKENQGNDSRCSLDTNFGIDDLEIFSDNITSDPVLENINDLLADLDHDLDSTKNVDNNNFTRELSLEKMLENITSPESNEITRDSPAEPVISVEIGMSNLKNVNGTKSFVSEEKKETKSVDIKTSNTNSNLENYNSPQDTKSKPTEGLSKESHDKLENINSEDTGSNDAVVTTSEDKEKQKNDDELVEHDEKEITIATAPDSTIYSTSITESQRNVPDSTYDSSCEMNSVISSTNNDTTKDNAEPSSSHTPATNEIENIGKLLSMLQDKSKIKKLLGLLGDQSSENEKIKKKLEKLSEIVSDDEESSHIEKHKEECNLKEQKSYENETLPLDLNQDDNEENKMNQENFTTGFTNQNFNKPKIDDEKSEKQIIAIKSNEKESNINETKDEDLNTFIKHREETKNLNENQNYILTQTEEDIEHKGEVISTSNKTKTVTKKTTKALRKRRGKKTINKVPLEERRLTRSDAAIFQLDKPIIKKPSRELQKLQEDIREMFIRDDILNANGIRNCRLAKFVDETKNQKEESLNNENRNQEPVVVLQKCNDLNTSEDSIDKITKKKLIRGKKKVLKSPKLGKVLATKVREVGDGDPYAFETDSLNETISTSNDKNLSTDSESDSFASSKSFGSTEQLEEIKKKRRKRSKGWKAGVIKPKNKKKKVENKTISSLLNNDIVETTNEEKSFEIPDPNCFTDKTYYFDKNRLTYDCRLCSYNGTDIVYHYKKQHPHSEIPLSRMNPTIARNAITESEKINFHVISKLSSKRYICRFCFKEFGRKKPVLESFFWHVVSMHTGEYKQLCSECLNVNRCPFNLDIPPPPKDKGQLLGYVCEKCNYTQISLENLKSHVILRHNDEQTAVCTVNLSVTAKNILNESEELQNTMENQLPRVLRSSRSNQSIEENSDVRSESTEGSKTIKMKNLNIKPIEREQKLENEKVFKTNKIQSKITFENDNTDELLNFNNSTPIKIEPEISSNPDDINSDNLLFEPEEPTEEFDTSNSEQPEQLNTSSDIFNYPHFKIKYSKTGSKEYICCINGIDLHYRTTLLISFKKHVQLKHSEKWDGYCFICKVIVTPQGNYLFKDCLQHFLDQHMDEFPILEEISDQVTQPCETDGSSKTSIETPAPTNNKSYINVRPLSQLILQPTTESPEESIPTFPVIESVVSLGGIIEPHRPILSVPIEAPVVIANRYEKAQAEIISKKHRVVLSAMMTHIKLVQVFKCAGRFCSFTTNVAEDALIHASTHTEIGGENSLRCVYCDFDSSGNAVDLITHVFKDHGCCPFVCGLCFYRAAASQLVNAHSTRVHGNSEKAIVLHTSIQTAPVKEDNILSREAAVPYYLCCASSGPDDACKFRTYTPGKFCEHLQIRHSSFTEHSCFLCPATLRTPADLIKHLKIHGLKLYQCTWCVFGADNETELLAHASSHHPDKQPKAYLRIITNKEGTSEYRVLPLAHLNKSNIPVIEITTSNAKDNPVRDAKRSIELENLIGQTTLMVESLVAAPEKQGPNSEVSQQLQETTLGNSNLSEEFLELSRQKMITPPPKADIRNQIANQLTPIIKTERTVTPEKILQNISDVVLCLDSDEENSSQNIIDLSEDVVTSLVTVNTDNGTQPKLLPLSDLFLCAKCNVILKSGPGFRKHVMACFKQDLIQCAHCPLKFRKRHIVSHYTKIHANVSKVFACTKCPSKFATLAAMKEHCKQIHLSCENQTVTDKTAPRNRRKRSLVSKDKALEPPEKIKRFGPQDISLLPINPILDESVFCSLCEFSTKVRLNMVRHLQLHAEQQPVPQTAPVNPVPHLETNEKHFDKMVNLASSSLVPRASDKNKADSNSITLSIPPEAASRYPKYVPEKHRHTCGAIGCSYISVDESMLKCHWETLHSSTSDFRCVHCPPHQQLDKSRPLTAARIIAHLKMHDATLYACSLCSYYHYKRNILENHLIEIHKSGQVMIVREENGNSPPVVTSQTQVTAPTMDLKPWQCGLCKFKSLLRPEVVEHCAKIHNSKMQYKCAYCAFRTSNSENITKHQSKSHSDKQEEIFYYYYKEGSVPDDAEGTPRWQKQSQKTDIMPLKIKSESSSDALPTPHVSLPVAKPPNNEVDLNLVKKELIEPSEDTIDSLCQVYGEFCEPNGLKYRCPLCNIVVEDTSEAMQSHLYEELQYRKWGCDICSYKAFHKTGLSIHMQTEHRQNKKPIELQPDYKIETWVTKLLESQTKFITKYKENLAKQKEEILRNIAGPSRSKSPSKKVADTNSQETSNSSKPTMVELERLFGSLGASVSMSFCCPKCHSVIKDEDIMRNHLENELNKIRWLCSNCSFTFQSYHEAQFHCRSIHIGQSARPIEATRDAAMRSAWIEAVIDIQKLSMNYVPLPSKTFGRDIDIPESEDSAPENSLLVVRYEERVPTPEEQIARRTPILNFDSSKDKTLLDETERRKPATLICPHCDPKVPYKTVNSRAYREHVLRHYNLKPISCSYCGLSGSVKSLVTHQKSVHFDSPPLLTSTAIPLESPSDYLQKKLNSLPLICLVCQNEFTEAGAAKHHHGNLPVTFGKKGDTVDQCSVCLILFKDVKAYFTHHNTYHPMLIHDYKCCKLTANDPKTMMYSCSLCDIQFSELKHVKIHCESIHGTLKCMTILRNRDIQQSIDLDSDDEAGRKRTLTEYLLSSPNKKVAKKSTTKLPFNTSSARKSTTKLPMNVLEGFSSYGKKPSMDNLDNVTALMAFGNTMLPFTLQKLNDIININPIVLVKKLE